jgi:hypothetical protein
VILIFSGVHGDFWGNLGVTTLVILGIGMLSFVCIALRRVYVSDDRSKYALPMSLIVFGTCFVLLVAIGRSSFGLAAITDSHYNASTIPTYLGVLSILFMQDQVAFNAGSMRWIRTAYMGAILLATITSSYDAVLRGIEWRFDQGLAVSTLLHYREKPDFLLSRLLFGDAAMVRTNAAYMETNSLGAFADRDAVPRAVVAYTQIPKSMERMLQENPQHQEAIRAMWTSYQSAGDLRRAFNPASDTFAATLLDWTIGAVAETKEPHYVVPHLIRYSADFKAIKQNESK